MVEPCVELGAHAVLGVGVNSVSEEWIRTGAAASNCSRSHSLQLEGPLRFEHAEGEAVSLIRSDQLQVPEVHLMGDGGGGGGVAPLPPEHERAARLVARARAWLEVSARVTTEGPEKWALHHLLHVLALVLFFSLVAVVLLQLCASRARSVRGLGALKR